MGSLTDANGVNHGNNCVCMLCLANDCGFYTPATGMTDYALFTFLHRELNAMYDKHLMWLDKAKNYQRAGLNSEHLSTKLCMRRAAEYDEQIRITSAYLENLY